MSLIIAESITKAYAAHDVLHNVSCRLAADSRVGLVGPNGQGKTTLLRILAGEIEPTSGSVQRRRDLRIGYLQQEPPALAETTIHEAMLEAFADVREIERQLHELAARLHGNQAAMDRYGQLQTAFDARGGYDFTHRIETVLTGLAFPRDMWDRPLSKLSGGQRTRAYLARLLLEEPDVLLLDEPTNHLDLDSVEWLERYLQTFRGALVVVSHDRYFLDRTTSSTWEVAFATLEDYRGSYSQYVHKRQARYEERLKAWQSQQEHIAATEEFIRRNLAGQRTKEAQGRRTRLERFLRDEAIPRPQQHPGIHVHFAPQQRSGDLVLRATDLAVGYETTNPLLTAEQLEVRRTERVAVVGANGIGKTTLLRTLGGMLRPLAGKVMQGTNFLAGYLSQTHENLRADQTVLDALRQTEPGLKEAQARGLLGSLLLTGDDAFKRIDELSGGQRARVLLAQLMAVKPNVLLLDEPTNHLDIPSQEVLQDVLKQYEGTILFVSHDRYLIDALATHIWAIDGAEIKPLNGSWEAYLQWRSQRSQAAAETTGDDAAKARRKEAYQERRKRQNQLQRSHRRFEEVEETIHELETRLASLHEEISIAGEQGDLDAVHRLGEQYHQADRQLAELMTEWEQLGAELEEAEEV